MKGISMKSMLLLAAMTAALFAAATNLFEVGGFENNPNGPTYGWNLEVATDKGAEATRIIDSTSGTAKEGTNFCRITVTAVTEENWHVQMKDPTWDPKIGKVYHFSIWARSDAPRTATISVYGTEASQYEYRTSTTMNLTTEWQQFHQMFTSDVDKKGNLNFALVIGGETGVYDFDDAVLTEADPPDNIYSNGSFEMDAAGWNLWINTAEGATGAATMSFPSEGAKSGSKFCRVDVTSAAAEDYEIQLQDEAWKCAMYTLYTLKFWAKADADSGRNFIVASQGGETREYSRFDQLTVPATTAWQEFTFTYTSIDLAGSDSLTFVFYFGLTVGKFDLDSITLTGVIDSSLIPDAVYPRQRALRNSAPRFTIQLAPEHLHCVMDAAVNAPFKVDIFSIQGRLLSTHAVTTVGRSFDLPRPPGGTWIIKTGSNRSNAVVVP